MKKILKLFLLGFLLTHGYQTSCYGAINTHITLAELATRIQTANKRPFTIVKATYGTENQSIDVTWMLQPYADKGIFVIPLRMDHFFGVNTRNMPGAKLYIEFSQYLFIDQETMATEAITIPKNYRASEQNKKSSGFHSFRKSYPLGNPEQWQFENTNLATYPYWVNGYVRNIDPRYLINLGMLAGRLQQTNKRPFTIVKATYGNGFSVMDVSSILQKYADRGIFVIPSNMDVFFGVNTTNMLGSRLNIEFTRYRSLADDRVITESISIPKILIGTGPIARWNSFQQELPLGDPAQWQFKDPSLATYPYWTNIRIKGINSSTDTAIETVTTEIPVVPTPVVSAPVVSTPVITRGSSPVSGRGGSTSRDRIVSGTRENSLVPGRSSTIPRDRAVIGTRGISPVSGRSGTIPRGRTVIETRGSRSRVNAGR